MIRISEVHPADEATLRAFWETEQESVWHDRPQAIPRTWDRLIAMTTHPNEWYRRTLLVARVGDEVELVRQRSRAEAAALGSLLVQERVAQRSQEVPEVVFVAEKARAGEHPRERLLNEVLRILAGPGERPGGPVEPVEMVSEPGGFELPFHRG